MLEKIGSKEIIVRDYTDNFSVKDYVRNVLIPKAFPDIPVTKLNAGFTGVVQEYLSQLTEDVYHTASLMLNENFITRAILPNSIYSEAGLFDLGYTFASPSRCNFAVQIWIDDLLERGQQVSGTDTYRYILDRDTKITVGNNIYHFDYDVIIEWKRRSANGREMIPFKARYDIPDEHDIEAGTGFVNSIALNNSRWIKCRVTKTGWLILLVTLQEYSRKVIETTITDNLRTTNTDITLRWSDQIAGFDLVHIDTAGVRRPMKKKIQYTDYETTPFAYYKFVDDNTISLSFSPSVSAWRPSFNDRIEATIYTTSGAAGNFDSYDRTAPVAVEKTGARYEYNADTTIVAVCYSGSTLGADKKDIEMLRSDVKLAYNTVKVLSTDHDLDEWFQNYAKRYDTRSMFFKRRDDPTGRLFSQFIAISDGEKLYPTNTLTIEVREKPDPDRPELAEFDYVDEKSNEFIIKPGHLWEYKVDRYIEVQDEQDPTKIIRIPDLSRTTVIMVKRSDGTPAMIYDNPLPRTDDMYRPFIFVNPFLIKIHRVPQISGCYNYLINHESYLQDERINEDTEFRHFQLSRFTINRSLIQRGNGADDQHVDCYTVRVLVNPILPQESVSEDYQYVRGPIDDPNAADYTNNNLRMILSFDTKKYGETGYIEMYPVAVYDGGIIEFEAKFAVHDNLSNDGYLTVDGDSTRERLLNSTITHIFDPRRPEVHGTDIILDAQETRFRLTTVLRVDEYVGDALNMISDTPPYEDDSFRGWQVTNVFRNDHRELTLYKPMTMMRSVILFAGKVGEYTVRSSLQPMVGYKLAYDQAELGKFISRFNEQYAAVEPVLFERLDNNCHLDVKLFNTYGRSNNYYIGDGNTQQLLDSVNISISFQLSVKDRMAWSTTAESVTNEIRDYFGQLDGSSQPNIYISNLIRLIEVNHPNVDHLRFLGINNYDASEQYIRVKYNDVSELDERTMMNVVPEIIQCLPEDIHLIEES